MVTMLWYASGASCASFWAVVEAGEGKRGSVQLVTEQTSMSYAMLSLL